VYQILVGLHTGMLQREIFKNTIFT